MKLTWKLLMPIVGFALPTIIIGYGFVIPRSCIAGVNELTVGFATTIFAACVTYVMGVRQALASVTPQTEASADRPPSPQP
jgi:hypothetical protein